MYTIQFLRGGITLRNKILDKLQERIKQDGRFRCELISEVVKVSKNDRQQLSLLLKTEVYKVTYSLPAIFVKKVRLTKKKAYCGNHPGECPVSAKSKPISSLLEWEDWVAFHKIVNTVLNKYKVNANMWSLPFDVKGRFYMRKGLKARKRYSWTENYRFGKPIRIWDPGTETEFL